MAAKLNIDISKDLAGLTAVHKNLSREAVLITVDKLELCLLKNRKIPRSKAGWIAPLSLFLSTLTTLLTAQFQEKLLKPDIWFAIFLVVVIAAGIWLICALVKTVMYWNKDFDSVVISEIKAQSSASGPKAE